MRETKTTKALKGNAQKLIQIANDVESGNMTESKAAKMTNSMLMYIKNCAWHFENNPHFTRTIRTAKGY